VTPSSGYEQLQNPEDAKKNSYETPGSVYQTIRRYISEGSNLQYSSSVVETQIVFADKRRDRLCLIGATIRGLTAVFKYTTKTQMSVLLAVHM
jgi:hypothetical protein